MPVSKQHIIMGVLCGIMGAVICLLALGVIPVDPSTVHAPVWVLLLAGLVFVFGGLAVALQGRDLLVSLLGNLIVAAFAAVGAWVALAGPSEQFSGGFFFLPHDSNVTVARVVFGGGAVMCLLVLAAGIRHTFKILDS